MWLIPGGPQGVCEPVCGVGILLADTGQGDVTRLQGSSDEWRLRVGDWRGRFRDDHPTRTLEVLRILPRGQAYR